MKYSRKYQGLLAAGYRLDSHDLKRRQPVRVTNVNNADCDISIESVAANYSVSGEIT